MSNAEADLCTVRYFGGGYKTVDKSSFCWGQPRYVTGILYNKFYYNVSGKACFILNDVKYEMLPGYLYFIPKYIAQIFSLESDTMDQYWLHFDIDAGYSLHENTPICVKCDSDKVVSIFDEIVSLKPLKNEDILKRSVKILELYDHYLSCAKIPENNIHSITIDEKPGMVIDFLRENYQRKISVDEFSELLGMHRNYLPRYFKKMFNESPIEFVNTYRLNRAELLLEKTNESVDGIAKKCGFEDFRYFERIFKKLTGKTPLEYRKYHKG